MYQVKVTSPFEKDFKKLDHSIQKRILNKLQELAENPESAKPVLYLPKDLEGLQKCRVGDWRVLFWPDHQKEEIVLYGVEHRKSVYKRFR